MSTPRSGKDVLAAVQPILREESTHICLRPDLISEHEALHARLAEMSVGSKRLAGGTASTAEQVELSEQIAALEERIVESQVEFTFRAMPVYKWQSLKDANPPREGDEVDAYVGYNRDTVLNSMVRLCMVDPVFEDCRDESCAHTDCGSWQQFVRVCNPAEWTELRDTVNLANRSVVESPKSALASRVLEKRGSVPRQPVPTE